MWHPDYLSAFHRDGSLRDVYIQNTETQTWEQLLEFLRSRGFDLTYKRDGAPFPLPATAAEALADRSCAHLLAIDLGGVLVHSHFFTCDEIEFDIDPREVATRESAEKVLTFMACLGAALNRDVILTEENSPEWVWFKYSAIDGRVRFERTV